MKKGIYFLLVLIGLASCSQDIVLNNTKSFQGIMNNEFWKTTDATATIGSGNSLNIVAVTLIDQMTLKVPLPATLVRQKDANSYITYALGASDLKKASYTKTLNNVTTNYQTGFGIGDGQIVITDYDGFTISGTYRFNAKNTNTASSEAPVLNLQNGVFYKIPITP
jgi:hypothetical protein